MSELKMILKAKARKDVTITDQYKNNFLVFKEGETYVFCYNHMNEDILTVDESDNVHFMTLNDEYHKDIFFASELESIGESNLSILNIAILKQLFDSRHEYMSDEEIENEQAMN